MIAEPIVPSGWDVLGVFVEGAPIVLCGVDPWGSENRPTGRTIPVAHPAYPHQRYRAHVIEAAGFDGEMVTFALVEVSAGVYAFFLQTAMRDRDRASTT